MTLRQNVVSRPINWTGVLVYGNVALIICSSHDLMVVVSVDPIDVRPIKSGLPNTLDSPTKNAIACLPFFVPELGGTSCDILAIIHRIIKNFVRGICCPEMFTIKRPIELSDERGAYTNHFYRLCKVLSTK